VQIDKTPPTKIHGNWSFGKNKNEEN
jgi:hypothetical protein